VHSLEITRLLLLNFAIAESSSWFCEIVKGAMSVLLLLSQGNIERMIRVCFRGRMVTITTGLSP